MIKRIGHLVILFYMFCNQSSLRDTKTHCEIINKQGTMHTFNSHKKDMGNIHQTISTAQSSEKIVLIVFIICQVIRPF